MSFVVCLPFGAFYQFAPLRLSGNCRIVKTNEFMELALDEARAAGERGEVPIGAVVVLDGTVVAAPATARASSTTSPPTPKSPPSAWPARRSARSG
jgi:hypothetical protein